MGNYNVVVTNSKGDRKNIFPENVPMDVAKKWVADRVPAPIGWQYQVLNLNKKPRVHPEHVLVLGFNQEGELVDERKTRVILNTGHYYTPKRAKKHMRAMGAITFTREKVWATPLQGVSK